MCLVILGGACIPLLTSKCICGYCFHTCTLSFKVKDHAFHPNPKQHANVVLINYMYILMVVFKADGLITTVSELNNKKNFHNPCLKLCHKLH